MPPTLRRGNRVRGPVTRWLPWLLALAAVVAWARSGRGWPGLDHGQGFALDFNVYHSQAAVLFRDPPLIIPSWVYPPAAALPFLLFRPLPLPVAKVLWTAFELALALLLVRLCALQLQAWGRTRAWAAAAGLVFLSLPVVHCIKWGQTSLAIGLLSFAALRVRVASGAVLLGAAAAIKLYPLLYAIGDAVRGEWRRPLGAAGWMVVFGVLLPAAVLGPDVTRYFFGKVVYRAEAAAAGDWTAGRSAAWWGGQTLPLAMDRWFDSGGHVGLEEDRGALIVPLPKAVRTSLGVAAAALALAALWASVRRSPPDGIRVALLPLTAIALFAPPGWHHYFAMLPLALASVLGDPETTAVPRVLAGCAVAVSGAPLLLLADVPGIYFEFSRWGGTTVAGALGFMALAWPLRAPGR